MFEELPETALYRKVRIPLIDFIDFPVSRVVKDGAKRPVATEHPRTHFRCQSGFYLGTDFFQKFHPYLLAQPEKPSVSHLFVWTLRKDCAWLAAHQGFEGKNQPVPWWVIRPFLRYVAKGERTLLASQYPVPFFMETKGADEKSLIKELVSLSLHFEAIHTAWWLNLSAIESKSPCREGQTFLSVA